MSQTSTRVTDLLIDEHISSDLHFHTVRVRLMDAPLIEGVGTSARNPADKYNANKGYRLALKRALVDLMNAHERTTRKPLRKWTAEEIENARLAKLESEEPQAIDQPLMTPREYTRADGTTRQPRLHGESYGAWLARTDLGE